MLVTGERGQTILEALLALALVAALGAGLVLAFARGTAAGRGVPDRLVLETEALNAEVDAEAATAYDRGALLAVRRAAWSVAAPAPAGAAVTPSPIAFAASPQRGPHETVRVTVQVAQSGKSGSAAGVNTWTLQRAAPFPGTQVIGVPATPPPGGG